MAINPKLLNDGERVLVSTRTHPKALIGPALISLVTVLVAAWIARTADHTVLDWIVVVLAAALVLWFGVRPLVSWWTTTYTFTDRRFLTRTGFIAKTGRTVPLNRISGIDIEIGVIDRIFGCGTLVINDASSGGHVPVHDIPQVEQVQLKISDELSRATADRRDDGT